MESWVVADTAGDTSGGTYGQDDKLPNGEGCSSANMMEG